MKLFKYKTQAVALTVVMGFLGGCKSNTTNSNGHVTPLVYNPHMDTEVKMKAMATQLDAVTVENVHHTLGGKVPSHLDREGFFLMGDFLYWNAHVDNLEFGYKVEIGTGEINKGKRMDLGFDWHWGVRVGAGYIFGPQDHWDFRVYWTYFHDKAHGSAHTSSFAQKILFPTWVTPMTGQLPLSASATWRLFYNLIDAELGRDYMMSSAISLRPFLGIRGAMIDQNYQVKYQSLFDAVGQSSSFKARNDFSAGGIRAGADMLWHFNDCFGITGKASASLLYGEFELKQKTASTLAFGPGRILQTKEEFNRVRTNVDGAAGLMYETDFNKARQHFSISALYELSYWFRQNELYKIFYTGDLVTTINTSSNVATNAQGGDLGIQGFTLKLQLDF